jgi:hypothetical protein
MHRIQTDPSWKTDNSGDRKHWAEYLLHPNIILRTLAKFRLAEVRAVASLKSAETMARETEFAVNISTVPACILHEALDKVKTELTATFVADRETIVKAIHSQQSASEESIKRCQAEFRADLACVECELLKELEISAAALRVSLQKMHLDCSDRFGSVDHKLESTGEELRGVQQKQADLSRQLILLSFGHFSMTGSRIDAAADEPFYSLDQRSLVVDILKSRRAKYEAGLITTGSRSLSSTNEMVNQMDASLRMCTTCLEVASLPEFDPVINQPATNVAVRLLEVAAAGLQEGFSTSLDYSLALKATSQYQVSYEAANQQMQMRALSAGLAGLLSNIKIDSENLIYSVVSDFPDRCCVSCAPLAKDAVTIWGVRFLTVGYGTTVGVIGRQQGLSSPSFRDQTSFGWNHSLKDCILAGAGKGSLGAFVGFEDGDTATLMYSPQEQTLSMFLHRTKVMHTMQTGKLSQAFIHYYTCDSTSRAQVVPILFNAVAVQCFQGFNEFRRQLFDICFSRMLSCSGMVWNKLTMISFNRNAYGLFWGPLPKQCALQWQVEMKSGSGIFIGIIGSVSIPSYESVALESSYGYRSDGKCVIRGAVTAIRPDDGTYVTDPKIDVFRYAEAGKRMTFRYDPMAASLTCFNDRTDKRRRYNEVKVDIVGDCFLFVTMEEPSEILFHFV